MQSGYSGGELTIEEKENKRESSRRRWTDALAGVAFCCFLAMFLMSAYKLFQYVKESKSAGDSYSELQVLIGSKEKSPPKASENQPAETIAADTQQIPAKTPPARAPSQQCLMDFAALRNHSPDIVGWIRLEGSNIDYPIVQTDNNDYYLNHLYNGERNSNGSIFMDYRNEGDYTDQNTVIYGHHMKNGMMFRDLEKYKKQEFYDDHPTMTLFTPQGDFTVELICGTVEDGDSSFLEFNFDDEESFRKYLEDFCSHSLFEADVELQPEDRLLSLCTCSYERANARFVVIGRLVPIME